MIYARKKSTVVTMNAPHYKPLSKQRDCNQIRMQIGSHWNKRFKDLTFIILMAQYIKDIFQVNTWIKSTFFLFYKRMCLISDKILVFNHNNVLIILFLSKNNNTKTPLGAKIHTASVWLDGLETIWLPLDLKGLHITERSQEGLNEVQVFTCTVKVLYFACDKPYPPSLQRLTIDSVRPVQHLNLLLQ